jgi:riboflavin kinase/FMN adenylyltransferase
VIFRQKVRDEEKFDGLEALKAQMALDVKKVREILSAAEAQRA